MILATIIHTIVRAGVVAAVCALPVPICLANTSVTELGPVQYAKSVGGNVSDPGGFPLADVQVMEVSSDWLRTLRTTTTDANGHWSLLPMKRRRMYFIRLVPKGDSFDEVRFRLQVTKGNGKELLIRMPFAIRQLQIAISVGDEILPMYGSRDYCASVERIRPNLKLTRDTSVQGRITDQTTAPFQNSTVELRRYISEREQETLRTVATDSEGKFDLGFIKAGEYRLLLSPHRGFKQPEKLECPVTKCVLDSVLVANPSDLPDAPCPIR